MPKSSKSSRRSSSKSSSHLDVNLERDLAGRGTPESRRLWQWIYFFVEDSHDVAAGRVDRKTKKAFWIGLASLLFEVRPDLRIKINFFLDPNVPLPAPVEQYVGRLQKAVAILDRITAGLTDDERAYLDHRRTFETHALAKRGAGTDTEVEASVRRVIERHRVPGASERSDEDALAIQIAQRICRNVDAFAVAIQPYLTGKG